MTSSELTGGAGFTYEDAVAAHYLAAMLGRTTAAAVDGRIVQRVAQQQADFYEPLDDVIVDVGSLADGTVMRFAHEPALLHAFRLHAQAATIEVQRANLGRSAIDEPEQVSRGCPSILFRRDRKLQCSCHSAHAAAGDYARPPPSSCEILAFPCPAPCR